MQTSTIGYAGRKFARALSGLGLMALGAAGIGDAAGAAGAAGTAEPTIGSFTFSGQLAGFAVLPRTFTVGTATYNGCVVGGPVRAGDVSIIVPDLQARLDRHRVDLSALTSNFQLDAPITASGVSETLSKHSASSVTVSFALGRKTYSWTATSGTVSTAAGGTSGFVDVHLIPTSRVHHATAKKDGATKSLAVSGSWSSCVTL